VVELMQKLAKEQGCTILLVTHDNRILDIAVDAKRLVARHRIVYMEDGRLAQILHLAVETASTQTKPASAGCKTLDF
jgi:ABC-type lipoprotein export system ATPase subunit